MIKKFKQKLKGGKDKMEEQENEKQTEVIETLRTAKPELVKDCYAVGLWLWAEFNYKLTPEEVQFLKDIGFRWNPKRKVWQNACGKISFQSGSDPRQKYEVLNLA